MRDESMRVVELCERWGVCLGERYRPGRGRRR